MRIAVWKTGHAIADTVAQAVYEGLDNAILCHTKDDQCNDADTHVAYGILRGSGEIFKSSQAPWFNVDRGYIGPRHYEGYYRISLRGTQQTDFSNVDTSPERLNSLDVQFKPWRGFDESKPVLVCPPSEHVAKFFKIDSWMDNYVFRQCFAKDINPNQSFYGDEVREMLGEYRRKYIIRKKSDPSPINFSDYNYVLTFNSSVGWQALQAGIPCVSDPNHSIVGSWFKNIPLDRLAEKQLEERYKLFCCMSNLQLSLKEMRDGMLWPLMSRLLAGSVTIRENPSAAM